MLLGVIATAARSSNVAAGCWDMHKSVHDRLMDVCR
jgi:hypothetical protein